MSDDVDAFSDNGDGSGHARGAEIAQYRPVPMSSDSGTERSHSPPRNPYTEWLGDIQLEVINDLIAASAGCLAW